MRTIPVGPGLSFALLLALFSGCSQNNTTPAPPETGIPDAPAPAPDQAPPPPPPPLPLSNLQAGPKAPLYTTYAAPLARSSYMVDEGYRLIYDDGNQPLLFTTDTAGILGLLWKVGGKLVQKVGDYHQAPQVTRSYSDGGQLRYTPLEGVEVTHSFAVYSSRFLLTELTVKNTSPIKQSVTVYPFLFRVSPVTGASVPDSHDCVLFAHHQPVESWSETGLVGYEPSLQDLLLADSTADGWAGYVGNLGLLVSEASQGPLSKKLSGDLNTIALERTLAIEPGQEARLRLVRGVEQASKPAAAFQSDGAKLLQSPTFAELFTESEKQYARIPRLDQITSEESLVYFQSLSLARQMMLPAEGKSAYNYYVFSREPTWGWGHDGQVFHESLVMLAYVHMDPQSAMDSQRVYMQRQEADGYIHYRIGPYVARDFIVKGEKTSSAPFFSWINWEIYQVAKDRAFLEQAYASSVRYVNYMTSTRDKDQDGLYEWGGHAVLECVRDGDNVIWKLLGYQADSPRRVEALDLNCMLVNELSSLAAMADELNKKDEATSWRAKATTLADKINSKMWDEASGFYYHIDKETGTFITKEGIDLRRQEIIGFLPLWAGIASKERAQQLLTRLKDPAKFWRKYGVPTLSADDAFFNGAAASCCRWNGPVWFPWEYLIVRGLLRYGFQDEAKEIVRRNIAAAALQLKNKHAFYESYSPDSDTVSTIAPYIWDGILARMLIDLYHK